MTLEPHNLTLTRRFLQAKHPARDFLCVRRGAEGIMGSCFWEIFVGKFLLLQMILFCEASGFRD